MVAESLLMAFIYFLVKFWEQFEFLSLVLYLCCNNLLQSDRSHNLAVLRSTTCTYVDSSHLINIRFGIVFSRTHFEVSNNE